LLTPLKNLFWAVARAVSGTAVQTGLVHGAREGCPPASAIGCWVPNWAGGGPFTGTLVELRRPCHTAAACPLALPAVRFRRAKATEPPVLAGALWAPRYSVIKWCGRAGGAPTRAQNPPRPKQPRSNGVSQQKKVCKPFRLSLFYEFCHCSNENRFCGKKRFREKRPRFLVKKGITQTRAALARRKGAASGCPTRLVGVPRAVRRPRAARTKAAHVPRPWVTRSIRVSQQKKVCKPFRRHCSTNYVTVLTKTGI
jgi:hypothetical protein